MNMTVLDVIEHIITAALRIGKMDWVQSTDQILIQKQAALEELEEKNYWFCYDVHVVICKRQ